MDRIKLGYLFFLGGLLNVIFALFESSFLAVVTFIAALGYGLYILVNEETVFKKAFENVKSYKPKENISEINTNSGSVFLPITKPNYVALGSCIVALISLFLPWVEYKASAGGTGIGYSSASANIMGVSTDVGIPALMLVVLTIVMCYKRFKYSSALGLLLLLVGLSLILIYDGSNSTSYNASYGGYSASASSKFEPAFGWLVYLVASLVVLVSTIKDFLIAIKK